MMVVPLRKNPFTISLTDMFLLCRYGGRRVNSAGFKCRKNAASKDVLVKLMGVIDELFGWRLGQWSCLECLHRIDQRLDGLIFEKSTADTLDNCIQRPAPLERDHGPTRCHHLDRDNAEIFFARKNQRLAARHVIFEHIKRDLAQKRDVVIGGRFKRLLRFGPGRR